MLQHENQAHVLSEAPTAQAGVSVEFFKFKFQIMGTIHGPRLPPSGVVWVLNWAGLVDLGAVHIGLQAQVGAHPNP